MKKTLSIGLMLVVAATLMISCSQDNVMTEASQVANHRVSISFFEKSIGNIGEQAEDMFASKSSQSRADDSKPTQTEKKFSELEVSLIRLEDASNQKIDILQTSDMKNFGRVDLDVEAGNYRLIAVAALSTLPLKKPISIVSESEIKFPSDISDMVYAYKEITVREDQSSQTFQAEMTRGVSSFVLQSKEYTPVEAACMEITIKGNCGNVFNPSTGKCKEKADVARKIEFNGEEYKSKKLNFTINVFMGEDDISDFKVDAIAKDKDNNILKSLHFENVHLVKGKQTTYSGNIFSKNTSLDLDVTIPEINDSGYSVEF